jgi:hypothetical protein
MLAAERNNVILREKPIDEASQVMLAQLFF